MVPYKFIVIIIIIIMLKICWKMSIRKLKFLKGNHFYFLETKLKI